MLELRGDLFEGGGQILRTSLALSLHTGIPFRLLHIRAGRPRPGLQAQHLAAVRLATRIGHAEVEGDELGSETLTFRPRAWRPGEFAVDVGTAGSVGLLLQACLWPLACAEGPSTLELRGGTDVPWAPPIDYLRHVTLPACAGLARVETLDLQRGYYPAGGGCWTVRIHPQSPTAPFASPSREQPLRGQVIVSQHLRSRRVGERILQRLSSFPVELTLDHVPSASPGASVCLWSGGRGASSLSARGKSAEAMAEEAWADMERRLALPEAVDEHLADQLVPLLALAGGSMEVQSVTPHTQANLAVTRAFLGPRVDATDRHIEGVPA